MANTKSKFFTGTLTLVTGTPGLYIIPDAENFASLAVSIRGATAGVFHLTGSGVGSTTLINYSDLYDPTFTNPLTIVAPARRLLQFTGPAGIINAIEWNRLAEADTGTATAYADIWLYNPIDYGRG